MSPPISAKNADRLRSVKEVPKSVHRIIRGAGRGELTLLDLCNTVEVVDDVNLRPLRTITAQKPLHFAHSSDGKYLAWCPGGTTAYTVTDTTSDKTIEIGIGADADPCNAAFSPDGKLLAIGRIVWDPNAVDDGYSEVRLYDITGKHVRTLATSGAGGLRPVFSPDGKTLAVGNRNYETRLFEVATGKLLHKLDARSTQEIAFSPDGKVLAAGYVDGTVRLWDVATGTLLRSAPSGCEEIYSVDWSPKGDVLATSGRNGKIELWEPGKLTKAGELDAPDWVVQVRFTADGTRLLSSGGSDHGRANRKIVVWAVPNGAGR